uniref:Uncharacterized protein n=1 Tax=Arundo donax TaxID=35708 RepID=A0A0A9CFC1_ARUDO
MCSTLGSQGKIVHAKEKQVVSEPSYLQRVGFKRSNDEHMKHKLTSVQY